MVLGVPQKSFLSCNTLPPWSSLPFILLPLSLIISQSLWSTCASQPSLPARVLAWDHIPPHTQHPDLLKVPQAQFTNSPGQDANLGLYPLHSWLLPGSITWVKSPGSLCLPRCEPQGLCTYPLHYFPGLLQACTPNSDELGAPSHHWRSSNGSRGGGCPWMLLAQTLFASQVNFKNNKDKTRKL